MKEKNEPEPRKLIVLNNRTEADHLAGILKTYGIPSYIKEYGLGSLYGAYLGVFKESGIHIFVPEAAYEEAKGILDELGMQAEE